MPPRPKRAEVVSKDEAIPAGTKRVSRTTREEFTAPLEEESSESNIAEEGLESAEILDADGDGEPQSPLDLFLDSLSGSADAVVYVIRKPDPPGSRLEFKSPCSVRMTLGEIPFDESYTDKETIDLAVQQVFGGGSYQLQIRQSGQFLKSWSTVIADVPDRVPIAVVAPAPTQPPPTSFQSFASQAREFADTAKALGLGPQRAPVQPERTIEAKPSDPIDDINRTVNLFEKLTTIQQRLNPEPPPATGGDRSWVGDIALLARELGLKDIISGALGMALRQAMTNRASLTPMAPNVGAAPPAVAGPVGQLSLEQITPAGPAPELPPEIKQLLDALVDAMTRDEAVEGAVQTTVLWLQASPHYQPLLSTMLKGSPIEIVMALVQVDPGYSHVIKLDHVAEWIADYRDALFEELEKLNAGSAETGGESAVIDFPNLTGESQDVQQPEARNPAAETVAEQRG